jgi:hypothetical protein
VGTEIDYILASKDWKRLLLPFGLLAIVYGAAGQFGALFVHKLHHVPPELWNIVSIYLAFQCFATILTLILIRKPALALSCFTLLTIGSTAYFGQRTLTLLSSLWEGPVPAFSRIAGASQEPYLAYKVRLPSMPFYAKRAAVFSPNQEDLPSDVKSEITKLDHAYILTRQSNWEEFKSDPGYCLIAKQGQYLLIHWEKPGHS